MKVYTDTELIQDIFKSSSKLKILIELSIKQKDNNSMRKYMKAFNHTMEAINDLEKEYIQTI